MMKSMMTDKSRAQSITSTNVKQLKKDGAFQVIKKGKVSFEQRDLVYQAFDPPASN